MIQPEKRDDAQLVGGSFDESAIEHFTEMKSILLPQEPRRRWVPAANAVVRR
jgi:hypothetical protein